MDINSLDVHLIVDGVVAIALSKLVEYVALKIYAKIDSYIKTPLDS